jgi:flagellar protein FlaJ
MKTKRSGSTCLSAGLHALGYRLLGDGPARVFPLTEKIRQNLPRSNIRINHVIYISSMFFWGLLAFIFSFLAAILLFEYSFPILGFTVPLLHSIIYSILVGLVGGGVCFAVYLFYPSYSASNLKIKIEKNLVYIANYMAILSSSGATPGQTFTSLASVGEVYGISDSARSVIKNVEFLGEDIISAIDDESQKTPSKEYADFLQGYIGTLRTGGNLQSYLMTMSEKFMDSRRRLLTKMIGQLDLVGEVFVDALVALPLIFLTMLSIMGFLGGTVLMGLSPPQIMALMIYALIPSIAVTVLIFIDSIMSSW